MGGARRDVTELVDACLELGKTEPQYWERALEAVEWGKSRPLLRAAMVVASSYKPVPPRLVERERRLRALSADMGRKLGMLPADVAERHKAEAEQVFRLIGGTQAQIEKFALRRAMDMRCFPCAFQDMVKTVPAGAAVISYFQQKERVLIFVLGPEGLKGPPVEVPVSSRDIAEALVQLEVTSAIRATFANWDKIQRSIDEKIDAIYPTGAFEYVYRVLIAPVRQRLDGCEVVYISADGALLQIPFQAALKDETTALIDEVAVAYTPGIAVLREGPGRRPEPLRPADFRRRRSQRQGRAGMFPRRGGGGGAGVRRESGAGHSGRRNRARHEDPGAAPFLSQQPVERRDGFSGPSVGGWTL